MTNRIWTKICYWLQPAEYVCLVERYLEDLRSTDASKIVAAGNFFMGTLPPLRNAQPLKRYYIGIVCAAYTQLLHPDKNVRFKMADLLVVMVEIDMMSTTELLLLLAEEAEVVQLSGILTVLCRVLGKEKNMKAFPNRAVLTLFERHLNNSDDMIRGKALAGSQLLDYYFKSS